MSSLESTKKHLISILGPTAVGKTAMAIDVALHFGTEILSSDSRQFFREMNVGTAKPSLEELGQVKHHFIDSHSIHDRMSAGIYERLALQRLYELFETKHAVVMVGGTGLYFDAVWNGIDDMPEIDEELREELKKEFESKGLENLLKELHSTDPVYFETVDKKNPKRILRALEVIRSTGKPYSSYRTKKRPKRTFDVIKIGLQMERDALFQRINKRMDDMISHGLFEEARKLYPLRNLNALNTVGYKEIFDLMDGEYNQDEAIRLLKRNSRRYAKRQMTWFGRDADITWFEPGQSEQVIRYVQECLNT